MKRPKWQSSFTSSHGFYRSGVLKHLQQEILSLNLSWSCNQWLDWDHIEGFFVSMTGTWAGKTHTVGAPLSSFLWHPHVESPGWWLQGGLISHMLPCGCQDICLKTQKGFSFSVKPKFFKDIFLRPYTASLLPHSTGQGIYKNTLRFKWREHKLHLFKSFIITL